MVETFISSINSDEVEKIMGETETNVKYFEDVVGKVVSSYTDVLDDVMKEVYDQIIEPMQSSEMSETPVEVLEKYFLELSNCIYFVGEKVEKLGVYDAMSKIAYKEAYNKCYMNPELDKPKPTVAELTAYAEGETIYNQATSEIYNRAYKIAKQKIDYASTMVSTLSKAISRRMSETQLSSLQTNNRKTLNESDCF